MDADTPTNRSDLSEMDRLIIDALIAGQSHEEAGLLVHRSAKYVQRRLKSPEFAEAYRVTKTERMERLSARLENIATRALSVLEELLSADSEQVRLSAVRLSFTGHLKYRAEYEIEERLGDIEAGLLDVRALAKQKRVDPKA